IVLSKELTGLDENALIIGEENLNLWRVENHMKQDGWIVGHKSEMIIRRNTVVVGPTMWMAIKDMDMLYEGFFAVLFSMEEKLFESDDVFEELIVVGAARGIWPYGRHRQRTNIQLLALNLTRGILFTPKEKATMIEIFTPLPQGILSSSP
ncbi:hypothetical protein Tco_1241479, partial [Tanacetum coccineum]